MVTHRSSSPVPLYASLLMRRTVLAAAVVGLEWLLDRRSLRNAPQRSLPGSAGSIADARHLLARAAPDVAIVDLGLADADAAQWIELLRSVEIASTVSR